MSISVATAPALTIGMPIYNNGRTLEKAVRSLLGQTFDAFRLVISDDGSKDDSWSRIQELAREDSRIEAVRQPDNLNYGNFRYLLARADTPFFVFAAGDDWWHPEFLEQCLAAFDGEPRAVLAISRVQFVDAEGRMSEAIGTQPLLGTVEENIAAFLDAPEDNSRMYGVFRTAVARRAFPATDHHAYDWTFSALTLLEGLHVQVPEVLMWRDLTPPAKYIQYAKRDASNPLAALFPLLGMTRALRAVPRIRRSVPIQKALLRMNMRKHVEYMKWFHPRALHILSPVYRLLSRRIGY